MKNYLIYFLITILNISIWYLGTSFIINEVDFTKWKTSTRFLVLIVSSTTTIGSIIIKKIGDA